MRDKTSKLKEYRSAAGLSQEELAEKAKVCRAHISGIERGDNAPSASCAGRICRALSETLGSRIHTWDVFPGQFKDVLAKVER